MRTDAAGDVAEPQLSSASRAVSGWLEIPRVTSSFLATTFYTARLTGACSAALRANQKKQSPRGLGPIVEGRRLIATDDCETTYENSGTVSSSGLSAAALRRAACRRRCLGLSQAASSSR